MLEPTNACEPNVVRLERRCGSAKRYATKGAVLSMNEFFQREINRVAEVHFFLRPVLSRALSEHVLTDEGKEFVGDYANYQQLWTASFGDRFFDMATAIRLGSAIEACLKLYYMEKKGHLNIPALKADPKYQQNIFQRVQSWQSNGVIALYQTELSHDLTTIPELAAIQEAMLHRHLYAHNSGLVDEDYIDRIKQITGQDLALDPRISATYPNDDTYWFEPLKRLNTLIESTRRFFRAFP